MRLGKPIKRSRTSNNNTPGGNTNARTSSSSGTTKSRHHTSTIGGPISSDLMETIFIPKLLPLAIESLERYADASLLYDDTVKEIQSESKMKNHSTTTEEAEMGVDGSISTSYEVPTTTTTLLPPPNPPLFDSQYRINELNSMLYDISNHFMSPEYKVHIKAAKLERLLDEKYGIFRPFIKDHPNIELFIRNIQRKYVTGYFHPLRQTIPPIPRSTSIILLFLLYRGKVSSDILLLAALFLIVGLQPWALVAIIIFVRTLWYRRKHRIVVGTQTIIKKKRIIPTVQPYYEKVFNDDQGKQNILLSPVGHPLTENEMIDTNQYDVILIGYGIGTLYTASLLSRIGRKVLVLSSEKDASGCLQFQTIPSTLMSTTTIKDSKSNNATSSSNSNDLIDTLSNIPFDVENNNIPRIVRQQELLVPALSTIYDCQGGIRFAKIGTIYDDYAYEILSVPGMGCHHQYNHNDNSNESSYNDMNGNISGSGGGDVPFILKGGATGGLQSLINDAAEYLGDQYPELGNNNNYNNNNESSTYRYVSNCLAINAHAGYYYLSKILSETSFFTKYRTSSTPYKDATLHNTAEYLNQNLPLHPHLRSLMAAIGMRTENISPSSTCLAAHITNICNATNEEGMHYPIGGPRALCHALSTVIEQNGGRIVTGTPLAELVFDKSIPIIKKRKSRNDSEPSPPFCVGVKLRTGTEIRFAADRYQQQSVPNCPVVVSMEGFIQTFIRHLGDDIRSEFKVPRGVPALSERRPVVHLLFALKGSVSDLNVTGADYYRLPGAALPHDTVDPTTGAVQYGDIGWVDEERCSTDVTIESLDKSNEVAETEKTEHPIAGRRKKKKQVKFEAGQSWIRVSFPSAKDPSFESRHGKITTCVVTIEADDDFVQQYDTKPKIFMRKKPTASTPGEIQRLCERVKRDLFDIYPQLADKILHSEISGPFQKGLSHNQERYVAKGIRADTPYPGLYVGGSDLTIGDSFPGSLLGGWLVANALCGYDSFDYLFLQKNITADLQQFLEPPKHVDADQNNNVAVPYKTALPETLEEVNEDDTN